MDPTKSPIAGPTKPPVSSRPNVRRLNRAPMIFIFLVCCVVGGAVIYTFHQRMQDTERQASTSGSRQPQAGSANDVLALAPSAGLIAPRPGPTPSPAPRIAEAPPRRQLNPVEAAQLKEWQDYEQRLTNIQQAHFAAEVDAIGATPEVRLSEGSSNYAELTQSPQPQAAVARASAATGMAGAATAPPTLNTMQAGPQTAPVTTAYLPDAGGFAGLGGGLITSAGGIPPANPNANDQTGKRNFLAQPGSSASDDHLQAHVTAPVSPYEVKAGSVIPATMIGGINSDLPGNIIAQVSQTVYDTATGQYPLIPQGARLVGVYHSGVSYGQSRVLVAWNRIIYPNGDSFDLGTMPGTDEGGYAGFADEVNNHYLRIFGSALLASVFSAGAQLSQPQTTGNTVSSSQVLTAAVGQQANEVGSQLIARGLDIQPTLEIRNGYLFNVMVTKDLLLQPWQGMAALPYGVPGR